MWILKNNTPFFLNARRRIGIACSEDVNSINPPKLPSESEEAV